MEKVIVKDRFDIEVEKVGRSISGRMDAYEQVLRGGLGLLNASEEVTGEEWKAYVDRLKIEELYPGIQGIGYAVALEDSEIPDYVSRRRRESIPDFKVWPEHTSPEKSAIQYLEPFDFRNQRAIGFDMLSNEIRRQAMEESTASGQAVMSGKVTLVQETDSDVQAGFLTYLPHFKNGVDPTTEEERKSELIGWVYSPFRMNDFMEGILGQSDTRVSIRVFDGVTKDEENLMFFSRSGVAGATFSRDLAIPLRGQTWLVEVSSLPAFENSLDHALSWSILAAGLLVTLLVMTTLLAYRRTEALALAMAHDMTASLAQREKEVIDLNQNLEEKVEERTRQLTLANEELQEFSRTVSHDLRAPLRSIRSFSQIVIADYAKRLDESGVALLDRIDKAGAKLEQTIDDILSLTTISRQNPDRQDVNLSNLVSDVCTMLAEGEPDRKIELNIEKGVIARGDKVMLERAIQNLIQNAWKFSRDNPDAVIEFGEQIVDGERQFYVKDNGVGFDSKYKDDIFKPFRRLHREKEFEGTGLGMASTRKMINRHGGKIWAESVKGEGATFFFTLGRRKRGRKGAARGQGEDDIPAAG